MLDLVNVSLPLTSASFPFPSLSIKFELVLISVLGVGNFTAEDCVYGLGHFSPCEITES